MNRRLDRGFDFAAYNPAGAMTTLVQVKPRLGTSSTWAKAFRRNVLAHEKTPPATLFVLVTLDRLYIWGAGEPLDAPPAREVDAGRILAPYFAKVGVPPEQIQPVAFDSLVSWWLGDLTHSAPESVDPAIRESGLLEALSGADIVAEATT
ncbi:MAG TPA: hypothetical protein VK447_16785 [Myxococcaceae bacterium]|nr:hypothetical protein [Myxococcaceae bacterium]